MALIFDVTIKSPINQTSRANLSLHVRSYTGVSKLANSFKTLEGILALHQSLYLQQFPISHYTVLHMAWTLVRSLSVNTKSM